MPKFKVRLEATSLYEVIVEAENKEEALDKGINELKNGEGSEVPQSFDWTEWNQIIETEEEK